MAAKLLGIVACANEGEARSIGRALVERKLAACVQMQTGVESIYRWKGAVEVAREVVLWIKTSEDCWEDLVACVLEGHSYEVPEILAVPIGKGLPAYMDWMDDALKGTS